MKMTFVSAVILGTVLFAFGQVTTRAIEELHAGARSFNAGDFGVAEQHFQKAVALDPTYKYTRLLLALTLHSEYRPGVQSATNIALAGKAIAAYKSYLAIDPQNYTAFASVAFLYGSLGESELQRLWLLERARLESAPKDKRAECYIVLASKQWYCSFKLTDELTDKPEETVARKQGVPNERSLDAKSLADARQCVLDGLELIEKAIALDPVNDLAWFYKAHLLREMAKLGEKEGTTSNKARYDRLATEAEGRSKELKMRRPGESDVEQKTTVTGDKKLDEMINHFLVKLTYLAAPVPIKPESPQ